MYIFTESKGAHSKMMNEHGQSDIMLSWIRNKKKYIFGLKIFMCKFILGIEFFPGYNKYSKTFSFFRFGCCQ